jgi:hypothetical protein
MKTKQVKYPILTTREILRLYGHPVAKMIRENRNPISRQIEEWIYYNINNNLKEHYLFENGKLVKYKMEEAV